MDFYDILICAVFLLFCNSVKVKCNKRSELKAKSVLNECEKCKVLTKSFEFWLDKTSRGKFEGGDAVWEETKLKSYSRSEVRLVEIQEGLCSELKKNRDICYALNEDIEQPLENWWFQDHSGSDLYTWLCINTLKHCCPLSHYGKLCDACPRNTQDEVCGGNGKCNGDGLRTGDGVCICKNGYIGNLCQDCAENYYRQINGNCIACHEACEKCTGEGRSACVLCKSGWTRIDSGSCVDVNECNNIGSCQNNEYCENFEGSFKCRSCDKSCDTCSGPGSFKCIKCNVDYVFWSGQCIDRKLSESLKRDNSRIYLLYLGLLMIAYYVVRKSKTLVSFLIIIIAVYFYRYIRIKGKNEE